MKCEGKRPGNTSTWNRRMLRTQKAKVKFIACFHSRGSDEKDWERNLLCFQICCSPHKCIHVHPPWSPPLKITRCSNYSEEYEWQVHLMVRLVINPVDEFASTMENLSALLWICRLPCRATRSTITRCYYHLGLFWLWATNTLSSFLRMEPCTVYLAPDNGDGLVAKGVAHQGGVLLHDRRPIVRTHLPRALSSCSRCLIN